MSMVLRKALSSGSMIGQGNEFRHFVGMAGRPVKNPQIDGSDQLRSKSFPAKKNKASDWLNVG